MKLRLERQADGTSYRIVGKDVPEHLSGVYTNRVTAQMALDAYLRGKRTQ